MISDTDFNIQKFSGQIPAGCSVLHITIEPVERDWSFLTLTSETAIILKLVASHTVEATAEEGTAFSFEVREVKPESRHKIKRPGDQQP